MTAHESQQIERANATGLQPVVFVHGLWLLPISWDRWAAIKPRWPGDPETVDEANASPEVFAHKTVGQATEHNRRDHPWVAQEAGHHRPLVGRPAGADPRRARRY